MEHADTLRAIAAMLDGTEWNTGMLEEIAELLRQAGCEVREPGYMLRTEEELHDGND